MILLLPAWDAGSDSPRRLAAGVVVGGRRLAGLACAAAARLAVAFGVEGLAVGQDGVDLPGLAVGRALDPELVLLGVAAGGLASLGGRQARGGQARLLGADGGGVGDLNAEVVEAAALARFSSRTSLSGGSATAKLA
jgi:hypothetical protein